MDTDTHGHVAEVELFKEYADGLSDIEGFSHLLVICWMHAADFHSLKVRPLYCPEKKRGVFATRSPDRPNPIAVTVVELLECRGKRQKVRGLDMIHGTPVLDIKPYLPQDQVTDARFGWRAGKE